MATLKANGFEIARLRRKVQTALGSAEQTLSVRSNGWILEKVDTTFADSGNLVKGTWKRWQRIETVRGKGPLLLDTRMPESDPRRKKADSVLRKATHATLRMIQSSKDIAARSDSTEFEIIGGLIAVANTLPFNIARYGDEMKSPRDWTPYAERTKEGENDGTA